MKKILMAAGLLTAALVAYTKHTGQLSFQIPDSIASYLPESLQPEPAFGAVPTQPRRNNPANELAQQESGEITGVAPSAEAAAGPETATLPVEAGTGLTGNLQVDDIHVRIARAEESSKRILNEGSPAAASPATTVQQPAQALTPGSYSGDWAGDFLGADSGFLAIRVGADGRVTGEAVSTITQIRFTLAGQVQANGQVVMQQTSGTTTTAASFTGKLSTSGEASGTWTDQLGVPGTWKATYK